MNLDSTHQQDLEKVFKEACIELGSKRRQRIYRTGNIRQWSGSASMAEVAKITRDREVPSSTHGNVQ